MNRTNLKQGTLKWEHARETRIGSSEVFDIVRYYATESELQNCGLNPEKVREERPYTTAWALYHKILQDGIFQREELPPEFAEYGHAVEPFGMKVLQTGRFRKLRAGDVYLSEHLIASLDISGISEEIDERAFDYGTGMVKPGRRFVCEQKTMMPNVIKNGLPIKYIIQAQYQIVMTNADFYILQIMVLPDDSPFERGKIVQMSKTKRNEYLTDRMTVTHLYFQNNERLSALIKVCLDRFFNDVENFREPTPYIIDDSPKNIIASIRINTCYNKDLTLDFDLSEYVKAKNRASEAEAVRLDCLQRIINTAIKSNASRFKSPDGVTGSFSASGAFLLRFPKGGE